MDLKKYVNDNRKEVTAPSGMKFVIRRIPPRILLEMAAEIPPEQRRGPTFTADAAKTLPKYFEKIMYNCVVKPRIVPQPTGKPDEIAIDDLRPEDGFFLLDEINKFSGLTEAARVARERFRAESSGTDSVPASATTTSPE